MAENRVSGAKRRQSMCACVCGNNVNDIFFFSIFLFIGIARARACTQWTVWVLKLIDGEADNEDLEMLPLFCVWLPLVTAWHYLWNYSRHENNNHSTRAHKQTIRVKQWQAHIFGCSIKTQNEWATTSLHRSFSFCSRFSRLNVSVRSPRSTCEYTECRRSSRMTTTSCK